jgi:hypothetical protein
MAKVISRATLYMLGIDSEAKTIFLDLEWTSQGIIIKSLEREQREEAVSLQGEPERAS